MKIAVTDACIFIDLIELEIIADFFKLDIELHTTIDVLNELYPNQQEILKAYESGGKLKVHNLDSEQIKAMESMNFPKGLSPQDRTVLFVAIKIDDALVLSSDRLVRNFAGNRSIEYHGMFWIFDQLVQHGILSKESGASKLKELLAMNMMYRSSLAKKEADKRIKSWDKKK